MKESIDIYTEIISSNHDFCDTIVEKHIAKYREIDNIYPSSQSFFIVINTSKMRYEFISKNLKPVLGFEIEEVKKGGPDFFVDLIHPNDIKIWLSLIDEIFNYKIDSSLKDIEKKLLYSCNFRMKNAEGEFLNMIAHFTPIEYDAMGKPAIGIRHFTVIDENKELPLNGSIKFLNDNSVYETLFHKNFSQENLSNKLSKREIDIIQELALDKSSKEIAERLFISSHTVDQHRRNILKKLGFKSTGELIQYCKTNNFF